MYSIFSLIRVGEMKKSSNLVRKLRPAIMRPSRRGVIKRSHMNAIRTHEPKRQHI